jgi:RNA polymerase-binding transcription factor DksA
MPKVTGGWRSGARGAKGRRTWRRLDQLIQRSRMAPARDCMVCGRSISTTRLRVLPHTEYCTACQVALEGRDSAIEP